MKSKTIFVCTECDAQTPKWLGRCPECGAWNSLMEETYTASASAAATVTPRVAEHAAPLTDTEDADCVRTVTGIGELDRVLGGGLVDGSVVLLAGEPGIGKSTLLMQLCGALGMDGKILYVSGEESRPQLKIRAKRLGTSGEGILLLTETDLDTILTEYERVKPDILICDEVLAVGDFKFQEKCEKRMNELLSGGTTLLFVSHSAEQVKRMCKKAIWIDHGEMRMIGDASEVCEAYKNS